MFLQSMKKLAIFSLMIGVCGITNASPTVIKDNRITDTALTPVLGRGYSISTNTFQSLCLADVQITTPSYDFDYSFKMYTDETSTSGSASQDISTEFNFSLGLSGGGWDGGVSEKSSSDSSSSVKRKKKKKSVFVVVELTVNTYYASVDEAKSKMSTSASTLLTNNDIPGFFASCGPYYVRSLGRKATFVSVFKFNSESSSTDASFAYDLSNKIQGFGQGSYSGVSVSVSVGASSSVSGASSFSRSMSRRSTTIYSIARGLGKNEDASLIAYDLPTYKNAVKQAFISMQNANTGKVTSMEIVPWVENTDFQSLIKLDTETVQSVKLGAAGQAAIAETKVPLYKKKYLLNLNAEFLSEINRVDRMLLNNYYKAKTCRMHIDANWKEAKGNATGGIIASSDLTFIPKYANARIVNHRTKKAGPLADLDKYLTGATIDGFLKLEENFMYGQAGAGKCIDDMMETPSSIFSKAYREYSSCQKVREKLAVVEGRMVGDFCMPDLIGGR
ncbi:MAG: hypothetical protein HON94_06580 [Methylococcales bacterium]|mgnify:CR=1 FL=1|jgi:hypothetical protein|nr:hypothetical protein [Methylococcales bacterium]MBT7410992.1 hypothetical protein [Methylococcales bacterium]